EAHRSLQRKLEDPRAVTTAAGVGHDEALARGEPELRARGRGRRELRCGPWHHVARVAEERCEGRSCVWVIVVEALDARVGVDEHAMEVALCEREHDRLATLRRRAAAEDGEARSNARARQSHRDLVEERD